MFPQAFSFPQVPSAFPGVVATDTDDFATNFYAPAVYDDNVLAGDFVYDFFASESNAIPAQYAPDLFEFFPLNEGTHPTMDLLPPALSFDSYVTPPDTNPPFFPPSPSPPLSSSASTPEHFQVVSLEPSPSPESTCRQASPVFDHIRGKWSCGACGKTFRGKWECKRHIKAMGKRAKCVACGVNLNARGDSLQRHFVKYCKGDVQGLRLKDAFVGV